MQGVIVLGHGSRAVANDANMLLYDVVDLFKEISGKELVVPAWMNRESGLTGLQQAIDHLVEKGVTSIVIAPWFLTNGLHIKEDIPEEIKHAQSRYPFLTIKLAKPLGLDRRLVEVLAERIAEAE
ncbi:MULTISPECIES: sirohydrochlorin chelatase [unclassified Carboxydocella]|uniref:sirohydrochlorin chelatase n=1 Tax=unclassified Carboxydocella TaxID=2685367 RepID=UPI0009ACB124|nr:MULTISPECIES: CbiX/SirB N-terminal domain-containing protein [unclassified Carboxydocella]GAW27910.1 cobalamin biosynthesis protein CbiX [Carboxydocella sp. ULO1]GAW31515.1 cobalamin biosynthesis protein CbiX [Carboxydocella sp. JDF658]